MPAAQVTVLRLASLFGLQAGCRLAGKQTSIVTVTANRRTRGTYEANVRAIAEFQEREVKRQQQGAMMGAGGSTELQVSILSCPHTLAH